MRRTAIWIRGSIPLALVLMIAIGGCGSGSGTSSGSSAAGASSTTSTSAGTGASSTAGASTGTGASSASAKGGSDGSSKTAHASGDTVATVEGTPITKAAFEHWLAVTAALSGKGGHGAGSSGQAVKNQALGFLISAQWLFGEAAARGVHVSEAEIHKRLAEVQGKQFKHPAELQKYLANAHETQADLLLRIKLELLEQAISKQATAAKRTAAEKRAALSSLQAEFQKKWKAKTSCASGYVVEDCREY
jgi:SurA N-terminal domain